MSAKKGEPRPGHRGSDGVPVPPEQAQQAMQPLYHNTGDPVQSAKAAQQQQNDLEEVLKQVLTMPREQAGRFLSGLALVLDLVTRLSQEQRDQIGDKELHAIIRMAVNGRLEAAQDLVTDLKARAILAEVFGGLAYL